MKKMAAVFAIALSLGALASPAANAQYGGSTTVTNTPYGHAVNRVIHRGRYSVSDTNYIGRGGRRCHTETRAVRTRFGTRISRRGGCI